eukprot:COSAG03_NODE_1052_length_4945_cov_11.006603_5_plen_59_part_00
MVGRTHDRMETTLLHRDRQPLGVQQRAEQRREQCLHRRTNSGQHTRRGGCKEPRCVHP